MAVWIYAPNENIDMQIDMKLFPLILVSQQRLQILLTLIFSQCTIFIFVTFLWGSHYFKIILQVYSGKQQTEVSLVRKKAKKLSAEICKAMSYPHISCSASRE